MLTRPDVVNGRLSALKASDVGKSLVLPLDCVHEAGVVIPLTAVICAAPFWRGLLVDGEVLVVVVLALCTVLNSPLPLLLASVLLSGIFEAWAVDLRELCAH